MVSRPFVIDLCCGDCGFAEIAIELGCFVIAVDIKAFPTWLKLPSDRIRFIREDVLALKAHHFSGFGKPLLCFAGCPCEEFARHKMPWTRKRNPLPPDLAIIEHCRGLARDLECPFILENSQAAQQFIGKAVAHYGPHYLWGDVPAILPHLSWYSKKKKESFGGDQAHLRARLPRELSEHLIRGFL